MKAGVCNRVGRSYVGSGFPGHAASVCRNIASINSAVKAGREEIFGICRPDRAQILLGLWFYKYVAPMALGKCSVGAVHPPQCCYGGRVRRFVRATGSTLQLGLRRHVAAFESADMSAQSKI